jgi:hypothetical protein
MKNPMTGQEMTEDELFDRAQALCDFIEALRYNKSLPPYSPSELRDASLAWDATLASVHHGFLEPRDEDSLYWMAAHMGYIQADKVLELFNSRQGAQMRVEAEAEHDRQQERVIASQGAPEGPARRTLKQFLADNGWPEERLLLHAGLRA